MQLPWRSLPPPPFAPAARPVVRPLVTVALLASMVAGISAQWTIRRTSNGADSFLTHGGLTLHGLQAGSWWRLVTQIFLWTGWTWLTAATAVTLLLAGRVLERITGHRHLAQIFLLAGVLGGLGQLGFDALAGRDRPVAGASPAAMGVLLALACAAPNAPLLAGVLGGRVGVTLRRLRAIHGALAALAVAALAGTASPAAGAMVGGLVGCLYVQALGLRGRRRYREEASDAAANHPAPVSAASSASWPTTATTAASLDETEPALESIADVPAVLIAPTANVHPTPRFTEQERRMTPRQFIAERVDPVLEKISREGLGSLTPEEKLLLEKAREKMR